MELTWQGWITLGVLGLMLVALARELAGPDLILMAGLLVLATLGVLSPEEAFSGFANPVLATVGALFILSAALRETGAMAVAASRLFGRARALRPAFARLSPVLAFFSAFLNNTTIVAVITPVALEWAHRHRLSPSRLLIPVSYSAILGGITTLIGTSTTLTIAALMLGSGMDPLAFFELSPVGVPIALAGLAYVWIFAPRWLPDRKNPTERLGEERREYTATMVVEPNCPLVDSTVEEGGLRHLPGLFLVEIDRNGRVITPVAPDQTIRAGDRLVFAGVVATIVDLQRIRGLVPVSDVDQTVAAAAGRRLIEAVISHSSPLVNHSIRDANFRTVYDAAVVAVHRSGERVGGKIGGIVLRPGDTLLLQTSPGFFRAHRNSPDFYLVSEIGTGDPPRYDRLWVALAVLSALVGTVASGLLPISIAAFLAAGLLVATRCISASAARRSVQWSILVVIGAGLGIALAMKKTGAAQAVAHLLVGAAGPLGPIATLLVVYLVTLTLAEFLNHNAAAAIMFPIAVAASNELGLDPRGFVITVAVAASCAFAVPTGYQTHLIVYGPGGYRFTDFARLGLPLDLICAAVALGLIPRLWPL
jgi:di/tricarboxylate transporter